MLGRTQTKRRDRLEQGGLFRRGRGRLIPTFSKAHAIELHHPRLRLSGVGWEHFASVAVCVCLILFLFFEVATARQNFHRSGFVRWNGGLCEAIHIREGRWYKTSLRSDLVVELQHSTVVAAEFIAILVVSPDGQGFFPLLNVVPFFLTRHLVGWQILRMSGSGGNIRPTTTRHDASPWSVPDSLKALDLISAETTSGLTYATSGKGIAEVVRWCLTSIVERNRHARFFGFWIGHQNNSIAMFRLHVNIGAQFNRSMFPRQVISSDLLINAFRHFDSLSIGLPRVEAEHQKSEDFEYKSRMTQIASEVFTNYARPALRDFVALIYLCVAVVLTAFGLSLLQFRPPRDWSNQLRNATLLFGLAVLIVGQAFFWRFLAVISA
jgi:hypothetical protein